MARATENISVNPVAPENIQSHFRTKCIFIRGMEIVYQLLEDLVTAPRLLNSHK